MAGTSNSITTHNVLSGVLNADNVISGLVNTAFNPAYALVTQAGAQIVLFINNNDYKMYAQLKDKNGNLIYTSNIIDLPLETMVVNGEYDSTTKEVVLTLDNGNKIRFSVADLISGLVSSDELETTLADYVKNTDYASENVGGVIKIGENGISMNNNNRLQVGTSTYEQYQAKTNSYFIGKGTLENVLNARIGDIEDVLDEIQGEEV